MFSSGDLRAERRPETGLQVRTGGIGHDGRMACSHVPEAWRSAIASEAIMRTLNFVSDTPSEMALRLLGRYRSSEMCRRVLIQHNVVRSAPLSDDVIERKALGMASSVEAGLGYWLSSDASLNARLLTRYYAFLQFTIAEQVASLDNTDDLAAVQRHTELGHGLFFVEDDSEPFPDSLKVGVLTSGHFWSYLGHLGGRAAARPSAFKRRPGTEEWKGSRARVVSVSELFGRIPELLEVVGHHLGQRPMAFRLSHARRSDDLRSTARRAALSPLQPIRDNEPKPPYEVTYAKLWSTDPAVDADFILAQDLRPLRNPEACQGRPGDEAPGVVAEVRHGRDTRWWDAVPRYRSDVSGSCFVIPALGVRDPWPLNLMLLYALSIVVRYRPDLWRRVQSGELDHIASLFDFYVSSLDAVAPQIALDRITGIKHVISTPGSLQSPI